MPSQLAVFLFVVFIFLLLRIEKKQNIGTSRALWIPTFWMLINASRPLDSWFQRTSIDYISAQMIEAGSPIDRNVLIVLYLSALLIILNREICWPKLIRENSLLTILFIFAGVSILWSSFPSLSIKRWIRLAGAVPMAIVVFSEQNPLLALKSILRRCAYVLLPLSILLMRYFPQLGRIYGRWSGLPSWTGVALTKNALGQLCTVSAFFLVWELLRERKSRYHLRPRAAIFADATVLVLAVYLLLKIRSMTSLLGLIATVSMMLLLYVGRNNAKKFAYLLMAGVAVFWIFLIYGGPIVAKLTLAVGKDPTFTARTSFWPVLFAEGMHHPIWGVGFGGYFSTPGNWLLVTHGYKVGHNGLLDVFLEIGLAGVILVLLFHLSLYKRLCNQLETAFDSRVFGICFLIMSWLFNFSESLFLKSSSYVWSITVVLAFILLRPDVANQSDENAGY